MNCIWFWSCNGHLTFKMVADGGYTYDPLNITTLHTYGPPLDMLPSLIH